jgi:excinuclease ABC subunit B
MRSLMQTCGRAARNVHGRVIMFADTVTASMRGAIEETNRRRKIQGAYNRRHHIVPTTIQKEIRAVFDFAADAHPPARERVAEPVAPFVPLDRLDTVVATLQKEMTQAAKMLEFEKAADLRDQIRELKKRIVFEK